TREATCPPGDERNAKITTTATISTSDDMAASSEKRRLRGGRKRREGARRDRRANSRVRVVRRRCVVEQPKRIEIYGLSFQPGENDTRRSRGGKVLNNTRLRR